MNPRPCVRCGLRPRAEDTFCCSPCLDDERTRTEIGEAIATVVDGQAQRAWLIENRKWKGGWSTRRGSVRAS